MLASADNTDSRVVPRTPSHSAPLSILHVTAPASVGGLETVVTSLARGQRELGHDVHVLAFLDQPIEDHRFMQDLLASGIAVSPVVGNGRQYLHEYRTVLDVCRRLCPSVVHAHGYRSDIVAGLAARRADVPIVSTVHGFTGGGWKMRVYERAQRLMFRRYDAVVVVSRPLLTEITASGVARERVHLVPNAYAGGGAIDRVEARRRLQLADDEVRIGFIGRLSREKGADVLLRALALLGPSDASLSILGDGPERASLESLAVTLGISHRVRWHGVVPDGGRCVAAFDVAVLSSRTEGTPIVLLEAMAAGTPVVATAVGGIPDVISSTEGTLVPSDDPSALAAAIDAALADPLSARRRAIKARARLDEHFAADPWLSHYIDIYRSVRRSPE